MTDQRLDQPPQSGDPRQDALRAARARIDRVNLWLHVGGALPSSDYERLREAGITHVVDLREDSDSDVVRLKGLGIDQRHVPVPDHGPPTIKQLVEIAGLVAGPGAGACVYVHCKGGFGRAATMAAGLLVAQGMAVDDAIEQVRQARPEMRLNEDQLAWLRSVERALPAVQNNTTAT
jgi:protein-tyrosine phosphatase